MSKKIAVIALLAIAFSLTVAMVVFRKSKNEELNEQHVSEIEEQAREMKELGESLKYSAKSSLHTGYHMIGGLVRSLYWTEVLPVGDEQEVVIRKLDKVLWDAKILAASQDAEYLETVPPHHLEYIKNSFSRRAEAVNHGQLMVLTGLLERPQADFVVYRHLSDREKEWNQDKTIQYLLGIRSESQKEALAAIRREVSEKTEPLFMSSMDPRNDSDEINAKIKKLKKAYSDSSRAVLTTSQQGIWNKLTEERQPPSSAPEMPVLTDAKQSQFKLEKRSKLFRVLSESEEEFEISPEQKRVLENLYGVIQVGLFWLSSNETEPVRAGGVVQSVDEFVKHSEQVALLGILSVQQADQVLSKLERIAI